MPADPTPREVATNPIHLGPLPDVFTRDGREVAHPGDLLEHQGVTKLSELVDVLEKLDSGGVQNAQRGAIQDPAGSAVGQPKDSHGRLIGKGASGAIYQAFDLEPIPDIAFRSAIFNSAPAPGHRVLHTHSPDFSGMNPGSRKLSPGSDKDRRQAIEDLANAYANALDAFRQRTAVLGKDGSLLNLVPVSAVLYAGDFEDPALQHLHPSYTICAVLLALDWSRSVGFMPPSLSMHFHMPGMDDNPVYDAAKDVLKSLSGPT